MGGNAGHAEPPDIRWHALESRDRLGRPYYRWVPVPGSVFGTQTVIAERSVGRVDVRCGCGRVRTMDTRSLRRDVEACRSCSAAASAEKVGSDIIADDRLRSLWLHRRTGAISRCYTPTHKAWANYGGRGIAVYEPWRRDPLAWLAHAVTLPRWDVLGLDLDRIDNDGDYAPGNLRLVSRGANTNNRSSTAFIELGGERMPVTEFWRQYCPGWRSYNALAHHIRRGRSGDEIAEIYRRTRGCL